MNYYLSVWIANLGVVPLLLFWALRFLPILTFLFALLFLVTLVLETITFSFLIRLRRKIVTIFTNVVKNQQLKGANIAKSLIILITLTLVLPPKECAASRNSDKEIQKSLMVGEVIEIEALNINRFTVGDKSILRIKHLKHSGRLLVKGVKAGVTSIILWDKSNGPTKYFIVVSNLNDNKEYIKLKTELSTLGIISILNGKVIELRGHIDSFNNYDRIKYLILNNKQLISTHNLNLSSPLQKLILKNLYTITLNNYLDSFNCQFKNIFLNCYYDFTNKIPKQVSTKLKKDFLINLIPYSKHKHRKFLIKLSLTQLENYQGEEFHIGLDQLSGNLSQVFESGLVSLIQGNKVFLNEKNLNLSTIASPQVLTKFNSPTRLKLGASIPYQTKQEGDLYSTQWNFAGLDISLLIKPYEDQILVEYKNKFSAPSGQEQISTSEESSAVLIQKNKAVKLFEIGHRIKGNEISKMPLLGNIPLLGKLFTSISGKESFKKVTGIILIEEIYE